MLKRLSPLLFALALWACDDDDDATTPTGDMGVAGGGGEAGGEAGGGGEGGEDPGELGPTAADDAVCVEPPLEWEGCQFNDGEYHLAGDSTPSSSARVAAYDAMMDLLMGGEPTATDFEDALFIYGEEGGLGSRVTRRYDAHVAKPDGADCKAEDAGAQWPEYCVGPALIEPLILGAFEAGAQGQDPLKNAFLIDAGALWFFYVSTYKEAYTCAGAAKDCDSSWAYFTGGKQLSEAGLGLGGVVQAIDDFTYGRVFEALLGVRCWRDIDSAEVSEDAELHQRALGQLDAALDRAWASLLIHRLKAFHAASGDEKTARWEGLTVLGPVMDRAARAADPSIADELKATFEGGADAVDVIGTVHALNSLFPCPY